MGKYIRTKDGIFEVLDTSYVCGVKVYKTEEEILFEENFLKQADTIDELCDEFVLNTIGIIILNKEHTQYHFEGSDELFDITDTELRYGIYGAIWTSKGLIYVAKMNEKGDLELL